jgi:hypothetical protein
VIDEDEYFPPPRELREAMGALDLAYAATLGADPAATRDLGGAFTDDRTARGELTLAGLRGAPAGRR